MVLRHWWSSSALMAAVVVAVLGCSNAHDGGTHHGAASATDPSSGASAVDGRPADTADELARRLPVQSDFPAGWQEDAPAERAGDGDGPAGALPGCLGAIRQARHDAAVRVEVDFGKADGDYSVTTVITADPVDVATRKMAGLTAALRACPPFSIGEVGYVVTAEADAATVGEASACYRLDMTVGQSSGTSRMCLSRIGGRSWMFQYTNPGRTLDRIEYGRVFARAVGKWTAATS